MSNDCVLIIRGVRGHRVLATLSQVALRDPVAHWCQLRANSEQPAPELPVQFSTGLTHWRGNQNAGARTLCNAMLIRCTLKLDTAVRQSRLDTP